jgi:hypothetical protein
MNHKVPENPPKTAVEAQQLRQEHEADGCTVADCDALLFAIWLLAYLQHTPACHRNGDKVCNECRP